MKDMKTLPDVLRHIISILSSENIGIRGCDVPIHMQAQLFLANLLEQATAQAPTEEEPEPLKAVTNNDEA